MGSILHIYLPILLTALVCAIIPNQISGEPKSQSGPYLGQQPPSEEPVVFAPGFVSTENHLEMGIACNPDGREIYFGRSATNEVSSNWAIWMARERNGEWEAPEIAPFSGIHRDLAPFITPDGKYLLFYRMASGDEEVERGTWVVERKGEGWGEPRFLVNEYCLTTADFSTFYFSTDRSEETDRDLAAMTYSNGAFSSPEKLKGEINSAQFDAHGCISRDGNYIVFDSARPGGFDRIDIYISFRLDGDIWSRGINLGEKINTGHHHIPSLTADGKYLFFATDDGDIYWVDTSAITSLSQ